MWSAFNEAQRRHPYLDLLGILSCSGGYYMQMRMVFIRMVRRLSNLQLFLSCGNKHLTGDVNAGKEGHLGTVLVF